MAHLWINTGRAGWAVLGLEQSYYALAANSESPVCAVEVQFLKDVPVVLGHYDSANAASELWVLNVAPRSRVRVNGQAVVLRVRVLRDRDEIRLGDSVRMFFSTETQPKIEPFPGAAEPVCCGRCKQEITPPSPAVLCPQCHTWSHQSVEFPCWTYGETCPLCDQPSDLEAGYRWTPAEL